MARDISAGTVNANQVISNRVNANSFGGRGGGGATVVADRIILSGWVIEASGNDGIYVTTPSGIRTKMELIDFRQTPVPETADLILPPPQAEPTQELPGGPDEIVAI